MKIETLKKSHLKRNIIIGVVTIAIISAVVLNFTRAKYRVTQSIPLVNGTINYTLPDLNIVAITVDGVSSDTLPDGNYDLLDTSYCKINGEDATINLSWDSATKTLTLIPFTTKGTKCYLNFETATTKKVDTVLGTIAVNLDTPNFANTSCSSWCGEETVGIYEETTSKGTTYYWRGDVEDNYLVFANKYWRIIRINEDGTIRIIYNGEKSTVDSAGASTVLANGYDDESTDYTQIQISSFNSGSRASYYVGYTYTSNLQRPSSQNGGTASTIKGVLDTWYNDNLHSYDSKIASGGAAGFCNDREMARGYTWSVAPSSSIYYAPYERIRTNYQPSYECSQTNDIYTTKIGLITADEVAYAGGVYGTSNSSYYLYTNQYYWTMSPSYYPGVNVFYVNSLGYLIGGSVINGFGVRPVINLSADVSISGSGIVSDPYLVVGA